MPNRIGHAAALPLPSTMSEHKTFMDPCSIVGIKGSCFRDVWAFIKDLCCYEQKSMKMKTTTFNFLFLVRMGSVAVAVAAGIHLRQG